LIVSGILLALKNQAFELSYRGIGDKVELAENLVQAIGHTLRHNKIKNEKLKAMMSGYNFIQTNINVKEHLMPTVAKIYRHLFFALQPNSSLDLLGNFYGEFLRYSGGDQQGLGIVLTPRHITELFADMAELDPERSTVLDICTGTASFLISSMAHMLQKAEGDSDVEKRVKSSGLIGIELDEHMFTLACANMIFRGDGKANMFLDDCLTPKDPETEKRISELKPNVSMLNPPYSKKAKGKAELSFIKRAVDLLDTGGICIAIVPVGAMIGDGDDALQIKQELLEKHTLKAVMSMPPQLFPGVGTVTAIIVLEAHRSHYRVIGDKKVPKSETWFGYWRDDGFVLSKNKRIERSPGAWAKIKSEWLDAFFNQKVISGKSCRKAVSFDDEWIAEAYMDTDYTSLTKEDFEREVKKFALYNLMIDIQANTNGDEASDAA